MLFSEELIENAKAYFHKNSSRKLSDQEAADYLEQLAVFGLALFYSLSKKKQGDQAKVWAVSDSEDS